MYFCKVKPKYGYFARLWLKEVFKMKERIARIMNEEHLTQQEFALALDISPSTLSGIFNARTQPTLAVVNKIHERFPKVNLMWLLYGTGEMYAEGENAAGKSSPVADESLNKEDGTDVSARLDEGGLDNSSVLNKNSGIKEETVISSAGERIIERVKYLDKPVRRITEINVYFDDGTYEVFVPRKS